MPDMSLQSIFERVCNHLWTQKGRSGRVSLSPAGFSCMYRAPDGKRCAIGAVMPNEVYDPAFDIRMLSASHLPTHVQEAIGTTDTDFLMALQRVHDDVGRWSNEKFNVDGDRALALVAEKFELTMPVRPAPSAATPEQP